jgi:hypothetical protein
MDGRGVALGPLDCIEPIVLHAGFVGRLYPARYASLPHCEQLKVLLR